MGAAGVHHGDCNDICSSFFSMKRAPLRTHHTILTTVAVDKTISDLDIDARVTYKNMSGRCGAFFPCFLGNDARGGRQRKEQ